MSDTDIRSTLSEKEQERLAKIDKLDSNKKRKKIIFGIVAAILIGFFIFGTIFGGMYILSYEGTEALIAGPDNYIPLDLYEKDIFGYFSDATEAVKVYDRTKLDISFDVNIPDESVVLSGENTENIMPLLSHIKPSLVSLISGFYDSERVTGEYGTDFSSVLYGTDFSKEDAEAVVEYNEETDRNISLVFTFPKDNFTEEGKISEIFTTDISSSVKDGITEKLSSMVNIENVEIEYDSFMMKAGIDREKNALTDVSLKRVCNVSCELTFIGEYADFGTLQLSFTLELSKNYRFTRVEMYFTSDVFYVTKGASDEFKTKVISDESPADTVLTFTSSDPEILSVEGRFFKANKVSKEPVTVSVEYTYNGVTYKDSCEFYVIVPVEGVKQTQKEISLKKGETKALSVKISPDDATLTEVFWFTTDENVALVDENGVVTAKNTGTASVYCITRDGNFKSSCAVEVSE